MRVELADGTAIELGDVETAPTIGITDYSVRTTDDFGVTTVVQRGFARTLSVKLGLPFDDVDGLQRTLAVQRAATARWIADDRYAWLSPTGYFKEFSLDLAVPPFSYCTLTVMGLAETEQLADPGGDPAPAGQASTLRLLQPVTVTDAILVASTVPETDAPEWVAGTSYAIGDRVMKVATHRVYEGLSATNSADPTTSSADWLDLGPTNRWASLDQALGTATQGADSITMTLAPGPIDAVALLDVAGATVRVQADAYDRTQAVGAGAILFDDLTGITGQITVTIAGHGQVAVGTLLVGAIVTLGVTAESPTAGITDYSLKNVDEFGAVTIVQRAWAKVMTAKALIRSDAIDIVANRIATVRAQPALWIGQDGLDSLTVYGFFKDFSIEVDEGVSTLSLSIEGLSAAAKLAPLVASTDWPDVGDPDGTKPADNATVGAPVGTQVAGRDAFQLLQDTDLNAQTLLAYTFDTQTLRDYVDGKLYVAGKPVNTAIADATKELTDGQNALAQKVGLIGATNATGDAFVLNLTTAQVGNGQSLFDKLNAMTSATTSAADAAGNVANDLRTLSTDYGATKAAITDLKEVVETPTGGAAARALFQLAANGHVVGFAQTNDGTTGDLTFSFDHTTFLLPDGTKLLTIDADGVHMPNVEIDKLKLNTAVVPARVGSTSTISGSAGGNQSATLGSSLPVTEVLGMRVQVTMPVDGWLEISASGHQGFHNGAAPWHFGVFVNDALVTETEVAGNAPGDSVVMQGAMFAPAGTYTVSYRWAGHTTIDLSGRSLFVKGYPATE